jgi:hypothetical protein
MHHGHRAYSFVMAVDGHGMTCNLTSHACRVPSQPSLLSLLKPPEAVTELLAGGGLSAQHCAALPPDEQCQGVTSWLFPCCCVSR